MVWGLFISINLYSTRYNVSVNQNPSNGFCFLSRNNLHYWWKLFSQHHNKQKFDDEHRQTLSRAADWSIKWFTDKNTDKTWHRRSVIRFSLPPRNESIKTDLKQSIFFKESFVLRTSHPTREVNVLNFFGIVFKSEAEKEKCSISNSFAFNLSRQKLGDWWRNVFTWGLREWEGRREKLAMTTRKPGCWLCIIIYTAKLLPWYCFYHSLHALRNNLFHQSMLVWHRGFLMEIKIFFAEKYFLLKVANQTKE